MSMMMMNDYTLESATDSCYALFKCLHDLRAGARPAAAITSSNGGDNGDATVPLVLVVDVLGAPGTPLHSFMTFQCGVNVDALCAEMLPPSLSSAAPSSSSASLASGFKRMPWRGNGATTSAASSSGADECELRVKSDEFRVIVRILCTAAARHAAPQTVVELLQVSLSQAVATATVQTARDVRSIVASSSSSLPVVTMATAAPTSSSPRRHDHHHHDDDGSSAMPFQVDPEYVQHLADLVTHRDAVRGDTPARILECYDAALREANLPPMSRAAASLWHYALDARTAVGGMDLRTRGELLGAALEGIGRELFPLVESAHVQAALALQLIMGRV